MLILSDWLTKGAKWFVEHFRWEFTNSHKCIHLCRCCSLTWSRLLLLCGLYFFSRFFELKGIFNFAISGVHLIGFSSYSVSLKVVPLYEDDPDFMKLSNPIYEIIFIINWNSISTRTSSFWQSRILRNAILIFFFAYMTK